MAENLEHLEVSASVSLYATHDVPLLLADLLIKAPWIKANRVYTDAQWKQRGGRSSGVSSSEAQCWLALRSLLSNPSFAQHYTITCNARDTFVKLIPLMNDNLLDQISPLVELKRYLNQICVGGDGATSGSSRTGVVLLEVLPQIRTQIIDEGKGQWKEIAKLHAQRLLLRNQEQITALATKMSDIYNVDLLEKLETAQSRTNDDTKMCDGCGKSAHQKCSRCKNSWYCSRNCQVQNWPQHKEQCKS